MARAVYRNAKRYDAPLAKSETDEVSNSILRGIIYMEPLTPAIVTLKKGEGRTIKAGGAWIYDNEIASITGTFKTGVSRYGAIKDVDFAPILEKVMTQSEVAGHEG